MEKEIKGILVDTEKNNIAPYTLELTGNYDEDLITMTNLLKYDSFEVEKLTFGQHAYDFYFDKEMIYENNGKVSVVVYKSNKKVDEFYGNVFVCKHDKQGYPVSLTEEELEEIEKSSTTYKKQNVLKGYQNGKA